MTTERVPVRLYCCSLCEYRTPHRWALARHLRLAHKYTKRNAKLVASESEYWLSPHYVRRDLVEYGEDEIEEDEED